MFVRSPECMIGVVPKPDWCTMSQVAGFDPDIKYSAQILCHQSLKYLTVKEDWLKVRHVVYCCRTAKFVSWLGCVHVQEPFSPCGWLMQLMQAATITIVESDSTQHPHALRCRSIYQSASMRMARRGRDSTCR